MKETPSQGLELGTYLNKRMRNDSVMYIFIYNEQTK